MPVDAQTDSLVMAPDFGEPARSFTCPTDGVERYCIDVAAGRWLVLMFTGSLGLEASAEALAKALELRDLFDDHDAALFAVSVDPADKTERGLANSEPGVRFFWDFDCAVSRLYGVIDGDYLRPGVFLIDPAFRVAMAEPIENTPAVMARLTRELAAATLDEPPAPVLILPRVFEPELCAVLIDYFRQGAPEPSGFAVNVDGRTVLQHNPMLKRRSDVTIEEPALIDAVRMRIETRLFPMIQRAFGWGAQHIERYLICRYGSEDQGFFFPHRDDVTAGTAHRKFAVTLNLNAEDYAGGELRFPEFGRRTYKPPTGGAAVFSCNLLHEATPVTLGERLTVVPFLFDDAGERIRQANLGLVG
ncbi:MAG TPA: 2OG-Fe(II) oxygenase [Caulobacteraceae bacterium]|nr:2OG-Fe(II) oxygenase [Caulobacteraceae bacterium]